MGLGAGVYTGLRVCVWNCSAFVNVQLHIPGDPQPVQPRNVVRARLFKFGEDLEKKRKRKEKKELKRSRMNPEGRMLLNGTNADPSNVWTSSVLKPCFVSSQYVSLR